MHRWKLVSRLPVASSLVTIGDAVALFLHKPDRFARFRRPLRVTAPIEDQISTYYLQLPYTYAIVSFPALYFRGFYPKQLKQSYKTAYTIHIRWPLLAYVTIPLPHLRICL
jgi:hypothetical protein